MPETIIVCTDLPLIELLDGKMPAGFDAFVAQLRQAGDKLGYPCFLRTGQGSGKHGWRRTCFIQSPEDFPSHVAALVEWSEMVDFMGLRWNVWCVRKWLHLPAPFTAYLGMPVAPEWRYFVRSGKVICSHFYWPKRAVEEGDYDGELPPNWRRLWQLMQVREAGEATAMNELAERAALALGDSWSIDICRDRDGSYWLTDCAEAARSFHWEKCPHAASFGGE